MATAVKEGRGSRTPSTYTPHDMAVLNRRGLKKGAGSRLAENHVATLLYPNLNHIYIVRFSNNEGHESFLP